MHDARVENLKATVAELHDTIRQRDVELKRLRALERPVLRESNAYLTLEEVLAVRLYSGPSYQPINRFLRQIGHLTGEHRRALARHVFAATHRKHISLLGKGKVGDVKFEWMEIKRAVELINDAGGVAVVAHPLAYKFTNTKLIELLEEFKSFGGRGMFDFIKFFRPKGIWGGQLFEGGPAPSCRSEKKLPEVPIADDITLKKIRNMGILIMPIAQNTNALYVNASYNGKSFDDKSLEMLLPIAPQLVWLNLSKTSITDKGLELLA